MRFLELQPPSLTDSNTPIDVTGTPARFARRCPRNVCRNTGARSAPVFRPTDRPTGVSEARRTKSIIVRRASDVSSAARPTSLAKARRTNRRTCGGRNVRSDADVKRTPSLAFLPFRRRFLWLPFGDSFGPLWRSSTIPLAISVGIAPFRRRRPFGQVSGVSRRKKKEIQPLRVCQPRSRERKSKKRMMQDSWPE